MPLSKATSATLIFPHQLFEAHPALKAGRPAVLVEDSLFFGDTHVPSRFHRQKLVLHRASMQAYADRLRAAGREVHYLDHAAYPNLAAVFDALAAAGVADVHLVDPVDYLLTRRLHRHAERHLMRLHLYASPLFLATRDDNEALLGTGRGTRMADFYRRQRRRLGILLEADGASPVGGAWSFDTENRRKLPRNRVAGLPALVPATSPYVAPATAHVASHYPDHPGASSPFIYPVDHRAAEAWLDRFIEERLADFGPFEDAIVPGHSVLYHSVLTPMLNIGLLEPRQAVDRAVAAYEAGAAPLASVEGFVRQVIGWREYMRATYERHGVAMRTTNFWGFDRPMPAAFYTATTGIPPIDDAIRRVLATGYTHHIERLMVLGVFMLLCRIHPDAVYAWFMELFIDAYDWVMVPNVYAMSQYADGGHITTKPYLCGSSYILKMSLHTRGPWCETWDALYWTFILDHLDRFAANPRWALVARQAAGLSEARRGQLSAAADRFLGRLFG